MPRPLELGEVKAKQFRAQVARWREVAGIPSPEVEFFHNWPKHEHLDRAQLRWFLYWRSLWERGVVKKTSLSYMMIHIYELLSLEYIKDPERAVERLIQFYTEFHSIQPKLDVTLVRWIGDLYLKLDRPDQALYWYTKGPGGDLYERLSWYRFGDLDIPYPLLKKVAGMTKTGFYRERMPGIEQEIEAMMHGAFRAFTRLEGMHPLDRWARYSEEPVLYLFSNTPIHEKYYLEGFRRYSYSGTFVHWVKNGLRCAENLLRRAEGKPKLKYDQSVDPYFAEFESRYPAKPRAVEKKADPAPSLLERELPSQPIELDFSRVKALNKETDWLVELMHEEGGSEDLLIKAPSALSAEVVAEEAHRVARRGSALDTTLGDARSPLREARANDRISSLWEELPGAELEEFFQALSDAEREFLRHLVQSQERNRRELSRWLTGRRMFLDAVVMRINEQSVDAGLEPLLLDDGEELTVEAEYEDAMRRVCNDE